MNIDYGISEDCQNLEESFGEICVQCNKCGRFNPENVIEVTKEEMREWGKWYAYKKQLQEGKK